MRLATDINNNKKRLIAKAKKRGLYENFGQTEVRKLKDKYGYNDLQYGDTEERLLASMLDHFDTWCMNVCDRDLN